MLTARTSGSNTFSYDNDANGNVKNDGIRSNVWDSQNRLVQCAKGGTTSTFTYGADGLRRQTSVNNGTTTTVRKLVLDNGMMVRERDGNGNTIATYLQGASGAVYRRDDTQSTQPMTWYVYDGLGTVAAELNPNGTVAARKRLDVYGITRTQKILEACSQVPCQPADNPPTHTRNCPRLQIAHGGCISHGTR